MSEEDGTADCSHMIFGARWSPEFPAVAPQNAGLERESYPASDTIRGQRRYFPTYPNLATSRQPPQYCAGATFASDTCCGQREFPNAFTIGLTAELKTALEILLPPT